MWQRPTSRNLWGPVSDSGEAKIRAMAVRNPLILSVYGKARFLANHAAPGEQPQVLLEPADPAHGSHELPSDPTERGLQAAITRWGYRFEENPRDAVASPSIATAWNNLGGLYFCEARAEDALEALMNAETWFGEVRVQTQVAEKFSLIGRAVVGYNGWVLGTAFGDPVASGDFREQSLKLLDQVPEDQRDEDYAFVQSALGPTGGLAP